MSAALAERVAQKFDGQHIINPAHGVLAKLVRAGAALRELEHEGNDDSDEIVWDTALRELAAALGVEVDS